MNAIARALGLLSVIVCLSLSITACSSDFLSHAKTAAQAAQAITQSAAPTGPASRQPAVVFTRPVVQAVGQSTGPVGETVLSLIAGISGLILAGISQYQKTIAVTKHKSAVAELANAVPTSVILTPATKRIIAGTQS